MQKEAALPEEFFPETFDFDTGKSTLEFIYFFLGMYFANFFDLGHAAKAIPSIFFDGRSETKITVFDLDSGKLFLHDVDRSDCGIKTTGPTLFEFFNSGDTKKGGADDKISAFLPQDTGWEIFGDAAINVSIAIDSLRRENTRQSS